MSLQGTIKGLDKIKKKAEQKGKSFSGDGESPFLSLKDGDAVKFRFLQELEESSSDYDDRRGTMAVVEEHSNPANFKQKALCTLESEGRCWACEQTSLPDVGKKWRPKMRFYANVLVRKDGGDVVKILAQGFSDKHVGNSVLEIAEEYGSLAGMDCRISRKGSKQEDTSYTLLPTAPKAMTKADKEQEMIDFSKFINYIPYDKQADFYAGNVSENEQTSGASSWLS